MKWTALVPPLRSASSRARFRNLALALIQENRRKGATRGVVRRAFVAATDACSLVDRQLLLAAGLVLSDLAMQGWRLRVKDGEVQAKPPLELSEDHHAEKARVRDQELVKRDAQLLKEPVRRFIAEMEASRLFGTTFCSIFSLMRDGRELSDALRRARGLSGAERDAYLATVVDPYLEFVASETATCAFTGLRLIDVWRYFRHTWTNQYKSVPGRSMMFLVRDRAAPLHPVVGIGAISSPVMQIRERDLWIGWHPDAFLEAVRSKPTRPLVSWLVRTVDSAISEVYVEDFVKSGLLTRKEMASPSDECVRRLLKESAEQRQKHHRYARSRDHKSRDEDDGRWLSRAKMHLFRSKRALALATFLAARATLQRAFGTKPTVAKLRALMGTTQGSDVVRKALKKAKADRVGIAVADISVCGAVQPYNPILGGKLVSMLSTSPELVQAYRRRYSSAESEIASSMAGRPIVRSPQLVMLGTTSLYGVGSSQYNRVRIPCERLGGKPGDEIRYAELGHSEAFGTSQYQEDTIDALVDVVRVSKNGARVNSIFGEGASPKMRKVRHGLEALNYPPDVLLKHHRRRVVYAVSLVRNLGAFLVGIERTPDYLVPVRDGAAATAAIGAWWRERWLRNRIESDDVLASAALHSLVRPVRHGARVIVPTDLSGAEDEPPAGAQG